MDMHVYDFSHLSFIHHRDVGRNSKGFGCFHVHGEPDRKGEDEMSKCAHLVQKVFSTENNTGFHMHT